LQQQKPFFWQQRQQPHGFQSQGHKLGLDSDIHSADNHLHVEFYVYDKEPYKEKPFVRIIVPGDKTNIVDQPVREDHKRRFPRQWLHFQMQNNNAEVIGVPLSQWVKDDPENFNDMQMAELQIFKFQTVEQVATATDNQLQRVGMGAMGLREQARRYLQVKNQSSNQNEIETTKQELAELKEQMAALMSQLSEKKVGRPKKEE
jgi:hypothetical protein